MYVCMYVCIHIYIERERYRYIYIYAEREREKIIYERRLARAADGDPEPPAARLVQLDHVLLVSSNNDTNKYKVINNTNSK